MMEAYISGVGVFLPNDPVGNEQIESVLGQINGRSSKVKDWVLDYNKIKTRHYAIDPQTGLPTYSNAQMTALAIHNLLKSQGMGQPAMEVLKLIPGVEAVESGATCCGIAGTYGLKKEKYAIAQAVGRPLFDKVREVNPDFAMCDTETCRWQIRKGSGATVEHPIFLVHQAYGLS